MVIRPSTVNMQMKSYLTLCEVIHSLSATITRCSYFISICLEGDHLTTKSPCSMKWKGLAMACFGHSFFNVFLIRHEIRECQCGMKHGFCVSCHRPGRTPESESRSKIDEWNSPQKTRAHARRYFSMLLACPRSSHLALGLFFQEQNSTQNTIQNHKTKQQSIFSRIVMKIVNRTIVLHILSAVLI